MDILRPPAQKDIISLMETILKVENLDVGFDGKNVIRNLSFELGEGESLALIGPNGSGKTVLLRTLLNAIPYEGKITWSTDVRIGYVPQKIEADRHLPLNLEDLLEAKAGVLGMKKTAKSSCNLCKEVGLPRAAAEIPIGHLSGGQFQRALIAFALLGEPNVLLLDEPTASIDLPGEEQIYELIHRLQDKYKMTIILVSHDLSFIYRYSTKVLCLNKTGLCFGSPEEALNPKTLEKLYGGPHKYFRHTHRP